MRWTQETMVPVPVPEDPRLSFEASVLGLARRPSSGVWALAGRLLNSEVLAREAHRHRHCLSVAVGHRPSWNLQILMATRSHLKGFQTGLEIPGCLHQDPSALDHYSRMEAAGQTSRSLLQTVQAPKFQNRRRRSHWMRADSIPKGLELARSAAVDLSWVAESGAPWMVVPRMLSSQQVGRKS